MSTACLNTAGVSVAEVSPAAVNSVGTAADLLRVAVLEAEVQSLQVLVADLQSGGGGGGGGTGPVQIHYVTVEVPVAVPTAGVSGAEAPPAAVSSAGTAALAASSAPAGDSAAAPGGAPLAPPPAPAPLGVEASPPMGPTHPKSEKDEHSMEAASDRASEVDEVGGDSIPHSLLPPCHPSPSPPSSCP